MRQKTKRVLNGFSLIEVSISLLIVGIVSGICMTQLASFTAIERMQKTQRHCDIVINALGAYYISSDGDIPKPMGTLQDGFGHVPFKELGIMEKFARDGYGNFILYQANPSFGRKTSNSEHITLGASDFSSTNDDKIAIILKAVDIHKNEIYKIWHSERNFKAMFRIQQNTIEETNEDQNLKQNTPQLSAGSLLEDD